jgi:hypothetical protein
VAQSPEYPDLRWIEPHAWGKGRDGKAVRYLVIHYTAGSETSTSAENGAIYNQNRRDGTSAHYFVDSDSVVQGVRTRDRANCARHKGNRLGIQYELCGTAQSRAQWQDAASLPTLKNAARQAARDCRKYGIPVRRLSVAETRRAWTEFPAGPKGFVGHVDCTYAYPEDGGDHTDPGTGFPWDIFLDMVRAELEEDDMPSAKEIAQAFLDEEIVMAGGGKKKLREIFAWDDAKAIDSRKQAAAGELETRKQLLAALDQVDENVVAQLVGATPEQTAAALKAVLGDQAAEVGRLLAA